MELRGERGAGLEAVAAVAAVEAVRVLIEAEQSVLLVVDMQTRLAPAIQGMARVEASVSTLLRAASELSVPVVMTEHCPQSIGGTLPALRKLCPQAAVIEKQHFDACAEAALPDLIRGLARAAPQAVMVGIETHVCVMQTALSLHQSGVEVFPVVDACASRFPADRDVAIGRMRDAGMTPVTTEMVMFEWLSRADRPEFRRLLPLIKPARGRRSED